MTKSLSTKSRQAIIIMMLLLLLAVPVSGFAQETQVNISDLIDETQKMSNEADEMTFVWWIPEEYWVVSFEQDPSMTQAQVEEILALLRPYVLIAAVDGKIGTFGGITYKAEEDIRSSIHILDDEGNRHNSLETSKIDADTRNFLSMMKPLFSNMLGEMGENINFYLFSPENKSGQKIADVKKEGFFSVKLDEREFRWRLPLSSLIPPKKCPACGEELKGAYKYCPWDGTKLPEREH